MSYLCVGSPFSAIAIDSSYVVSNFLFCPKHFPLSSTLLSSSYHCSELVPFPNVSLPIPHTYILFSVFYFTPLLFHFSFCHKLCFYPQHHLVIGSFLFWYSIPLKAYIPSFYSVTHCTCTRFGHYPGIVLRHLDFSFCPKLCHFFQHTALVLSSSLLRPDQVLKSPCIFPDCLSFWLYPVPFIILVSSLCYTLSCVS